MTLAGQEASHYSRREIIVMLEPPVFVSIAAGVCAPGEIPKRSSKVRGEEHCNFWIMNRKQESKKNEGLHYMPIFGVRWHWRRKPYVSA